MGPHLLTVRGQPSSYDGLISIDCGLSSNTTYTDSITNIPYVSDDQFVNTGVKANISSDYITSSLTTQLSTLRSFPDGFRNCYLLNVTQDYNLWRIVSITGPNEVWRPEAIFVASADTVSVYLIKTGTAIPFISALELRPLGRNLYPFANETQTVALRYGKNLMPTTNRNIR
ncbi:LRR receptor-like serine/threonine-protein kinase IOS1 [Zingiber officinale]|uniref:LRR receptor-like serine/threonine-protein kinase IOS1 n=1 Tax=Zingiber officinale TaxID=94328 RepID=UPI001C4C5359|nr:LRR receptor-like serine/threonine-protein kinase IOS1 [Zingiber officinale]